MMVTQKKAAAGSWAAMVSIVAAIALGSSAAAQTPNAQTPDAQAPAAPPPASASAAAMAQPSPPTDRGEYVARAANCVACHSVPGAKAFVGGLKMMTPLGAIYSTNITPDHATGIGDYTLADFDRAIRKGVAKDGHHLYPAMPYPSYAKLNDDDVKALYDYFMKEVPAENHSNGASEIRWPLNMRWPLAIWDWFFYDPKPYTQKPEHDAAWNRGAYLVQGLGHCGACHTPRSIAFNEKALDDSSKVYLSGAPLDNWSAPDLTGTPGSGLSGWSAADIADFLKTGHNRAGTAFGTMIEVINNSTQFLTDDDLGAIAAYLKALPPAHEGRAYVADNATTDALTHRKTDQPGSAAYLQYCEACHGLDGRGYAPYLPSLAGNPAVLDPDPSSVIDVGLNGSARIVVAGLPDSYRMPQFRVMLNDAQIADVVSFVRGAWGDNAAPVTPADVARIRDETNPASDRIEVLRMK